MTTAQSIVDQARGTLIDTDKITWTDAELLGYLNQGIAQAAGTLLGLYVVTSLVSLVAGTRQTLPAGGLMLLEIPRNGLGNAVRQASGAEFAKTRPTWPGETASNDTKFFFYEPHAPTSFMVYPPANVGAQVECVYAAVPPAVTLAGTVPISPAFDTALWAFTIGLAYAKNTKRQDLGQSKLFLELYGGALANWKKGLGESASAPDPKGVY